MVLVTYLIMEVVSCIIEVFVTTLCSSAPAAS